MSPEPPSESLPPVYFDEVYRARPDPWDFTTSPYEAAKYEATLTALPRPHYQSAFEAGCSIGVLTARLAARCERLLSVDVSEDALAQARARCAGLPQVRLERRQLPAEFPDETFDLVLVSEIGYYFSPTDLERLRERCISQLGPHGHLLLVHWTPRVHDYPLTGDAVHEAFLAAAAEGRLLHRTGQRADRYRLDLFERR